MSYTDLKETRSYTQDDKTLNVNAEEFGPKKSAAAVAEQRVRDITDDENQRNTFNLHYQMGGEQCGNSRSRAIR